MGADLADMQLINKYKEETRFLLWISDNYNKYAWFIPSGEQKWNVH